jgi:hypothetical protein
MLLKSVVSLALLGLATAQRPDRTGYVVTLNGVVYDAGEDGEIRIRDNLPCRGIVKVRGVHNGFDLDCSNMNMYNFGFTAAGNLDGKLSMFTYIPMRERC